MKHEPQKRHAEHVGAVEYAEEKRAERNRRFFVFYYDYPEPEFLRMKAFLFNPKQSKGE